jgi:hypothetical protein
MELQGITNVSDHQNNLHGNWLHLAYGRNKYRVYVGENTILCKDLYSKEERTISCQDMYTKEDMHLIIDFIYDHGWMNPYDPYPIQRKLLGLDKKMLITGLKELL